MTRLSPQPKDDNPSPLLEPLTEREWDILRLLVKRLSNAEIAQSLTLSVSTVKWYVKQIFSKLDVHNRAEAVARAAQLGLLDDRPPMALPTIEEAAQPIGPLIGPLFVARDRELNRLAALLDRTLAGESQIAFIVGEAGQGKTALLNEFARRAQQTHANLLVASGSCNAYSGVGDPYLPFRDILDMLCGNVEAKWTVGALTRDHAHRLWAALLHTLQAISDEGPDLLDVFVSGSVLLRRVAALPEIDFAKRLRDLIDRQRNVASQRRQPQLFEQYASVLRRVAVRQPLILLLDDVQWIDEASLHLLFHLGRRLSGSRIMIVGAYRPSDVATETSATRSDDRPQRLTLDEVIIEFKRRFGEVQIDLTQLESAEEREFVDAILDSEPNQLDESFRTDLFRLTRGHPLFTIELLRSLQEHGELMRDDVGRWQVSPTLSWHTLPARVEAVIAQRLQHLSGGLLNLLQVASVEGEDFTADVISAVLHIDENQTAEMLVGELAKRQRLIRERGEIEIGRRLLARYQFSHALFQHYVYQSLSAHERRQLHQQVAQALETLYENHSDDIAVQLAHHFTQAADREKAARYLRRAGDRARRSAAFDEAVRYYQAALTQWAADDAIGQVELLRALGECWWALGNFQRAIKTFEEVYGRYNAMNDPQNAGAMQRVMGRIYWEASDRAQSSQHYRQALAILEPLGDSVELAHAYGGLSTIYLLADELDEALAWGQRALVLGERLTAEDVIVHALNNLGTALSYTQPERGVALIQESLRRALAADLPHAVCRGYANFADALRHLDRYPEAHDAYQAFVAYAERWHMGMYAHYARAELFHLEWLRGDWSAWQRHHQLLLEPISGEVNQHIGTAFAGTFLGQAYNDVGQPEAARRVLGLTGAQARGAAEPQTTLPYLGELARADAQLGREAETRASITTIIEWVERVTLTHPNSIMALHFACQWAAEHRLIDLARRGLRQLERTLEIQPLPETAASLSEARGHVALAESDLHLAIKSLDEALDKWASQSRPYDQIRTLNSLSHALSKSGDDAGARARRIQALEIGERMAAQLNTEQMVTAFLNSSLVQELRQGRKSLVENSS
ncbi:MAG: AAA family ATPase [Anaerolineae bacterium]